MRSVSRLLIAFVVASVTRVAAQSVRYEVAVTDPASHLFHVTAEFPSAGKDTLYLSLPAWSPGAYEIQNYARYVRGFSATNAAGESLFWDRFDKDTWRVVTGKSARVTAQFDFLGDTIDLSLARLTGTFGQFLGTNLFLFEEGQLGRPADVRFRVPTGWQVTTALPSTSTGVYRAADYHELADAMTFVGRYTLDSLQVDGKWIRIALWPAADYTPPVARSFRGAIEKMAQVQNRLMGGAPYDVYTVFFNVIHDRVDFGGGLEHATSQYDIMPAGPDFADANGQLGSFIRPLLSHEFFHLWNVKRIRPAEMWPYDYHAEQFTPLLWWSEGVTDYYADVTNLRAGLWSNEQFIQNVNDNMQQVEGAPEPWSAEDGSVATWIHEVFVNSSQLYYQKGSLLGLLLDISIRDATNNAHSLDEVTRSLYTGFYRQGRGFATGDLLRLLAEAGLPNGDTFYQRYINGRDPLPYDSVFARAGIVVQRDTTSEFSLGTQLSLTADREIVVERVQPDGSAATAGVRPGDVLLKIGDV
ncbi:MAG TPA: PDZ domain-containing protein, partial [Gemmatimonadales bacterium]|nr:PDZ domain-containing protein [Gemmatimonadales bacterium]